MHEFPLPCDVQKEPMRQYTNLPIRKSANP
jgi:hypothetical protein